MPEVISDINIFRLKSSNLDSTHSRNDVKTLKIGSGSANISAVQQHAVVRVVSNPKYIKSTHDYDVGLVKVAIPFVVSAVRKPVPLVNVGEEAAGGEPVVVAGWGFAEVSVYCLGSFVNIVRYPPIQSSKFEEKGPFSLFVCFNLVLRIIHTLLE